MRFRTACLALVVLAMTLTSAVEAKGPTVKLTVTGPPLSNPIDITTPRAVSATVYGGEFIGAVATEPPTVLPRYTVSFHVQLPREQGVRVMYVVYYARDPLTGHGFVYLPARGEEWGRLNSSTISRDGQDGRWHHATQSWSDALAASLP